MKKLFTLLLSALVIQGFAQTDEQDKSEGLKKIYSFDNSSELFSQFDQFVEIDMPDLHFDFNFEEFEFEWDEDFDLEHEYDFDEDFDFDFEHDMEFSKDFELDMKGLHEQLGEMKEDIKDLMRKIKKN